MKAVFELLSSGKKMAIKIVPETDFERSFVERFKNDLSHIQDCCSQYSLILDLKHEAKETSND